VKRLTAIISIMAIIFSCAWLFADDGNPKDNPVAENSVTEAPKDTVKTKSEEPSCAKGLDLDLAYQSMLEKAHESYRSERRAAWDKFRDSAFAARSKRDKIVEAECNKCCDSVKNAWKDLRNSVENAKVKDARKVAREKWRALKNAVCSGKNSASIAVDAALANYEKEMNAAKKALKDSLKNAHAKLEQTENAAYETWEKSQHQKVEVLETPKVETEVKTPENKTDK